MLLHQEFGGWMLGSARSDLWTPQDGSWSLPVVLALIAAFALGVVLPVGVIISVVRRGRRGPDRKPKKNWVRGHARIVSVHVLYGRRNSGPSGEPGQFQLDVVLEAPGIPPTALRDVRWVKSPIWPDTRMIVPVLVDPANPKDFAFLWDELPPVPDEGEQRAHDLEARMRAAAPVDNYGRPPGMLASAAAGTTSQPAARGRRLILTGLSDVPPADALKALAALRDRGLLSDAEFEEQKNTLAL